MGEIFKKELPHAALQYTDERFTEGHGLETEIEHYHRYFFARSYCRGKDVLDIASGEGYGSAILAQVASSVTGIDVCDEAIKHAQTMHTRSNLKYMTGDVRKIPLEDQSIDVVVSFETLEHFYEHELFMQEVKRVLRPNGCLIISTPNSDIYSAIGIPANPYHVNELTKTEFISLCKKYFRFMSIVNQRTLVGSVLINDNDTTGLPILFESRDENFVECSKGLSRAFYLISVLSDIDNVSVSNSIYINEDIRNLLNIQSQQFQQMLEEKNEHIQNLENIIATSDKHIQNLEHIASDKEKHVQNLKNIVIDKDKHIKNLEHITEDKEKHIQNLENNLLDKEKYIHHLCNIIEYFKNQLSKSTFSWIRKKILDKNAIKICSNSTFFDMNWYLAQYPDVKEANLNPVVHYIKFGAIEGRDPGPNFSTKSYLINNPKIQKTGVNPLVHFEKSNKKCTA